MANILTVSRLLLIPLFLYFMFLPSPQNLLAALVFGLAAATDFLDGCVARKLNQVTELGKILDPFIDRIFIVTAICALYVRDRQPPLATLLILLMREVFLLLGFVYFRNRGVKLSVSFLGKTATAMLMTALALLILQIQPALLLFYLGLVLYILAAIDYARTALKINT